MIVIGSGVDTFADRGRSEDFAAVGIDNRHHLVVASGEEATVLAIDGQPTGLGAGRERPFRFDREGVGIDRGQLALIFDVDKHRALGIAGGELGLAVELDRAQNFSAGAINRAGILAASIERENALGRRIVEDRVGILADLHFFANGLKRLKVENGNGAFAAVAGESASEVGRERDAMHALGIGDIADGFAGINVEHNYVRASRDIEPAGIRVGAEIIPATFAAQLVSFGHVVSRTSGGPCQSRQGHTENAYQPLRLRRHEFLLKCCCELPGDGAPSR